MTERGARRGAGGPFYAPPRRKTSAEIISEARAAIYGGLSTEMNGASSTAGSVGGSLRPLRTRRPYTPREPQRTLFAERREGRKKEKDTRPPSALDLKYLSLSESSEEALITMGARVAGIDDDTINGVLLTDSSNQSSNRKKPTLRNQTRSMQERFGDGWSGFPKLPNLSGRAKPLHRRNTLQGEESKTENELMQTISISRPLGGMEGDVIGSDTFNAELQMQLSKSLSPDSGSKRKLFAGSKSFSYDTSVNRNAIGDIGVKHLGDIGVKHQAPNTSVYQINSMNVLELCDALSKRSRDVDRTIILMETLQNRIEAATPASSLRDLVMRSLYTHIDCEDERVLVAIARAMLTNKRVRRRLSFDCVEAVISTGRELRRSGGSIQNLECASNCMAADLSTTCTIGAIYKMRVTGTHLAAACKLVFKIARNDKNDHFFRDTNLLELVVEGCGRADPVAESECCVYGAGALRVLALEPRLCARAHAHGAVHLAAIHLKLLNAAKAENHRSMSEQSTHALYQLTGALRNLASETRAASEFVNSGALAELINALLYHTDRDVLTNVARCLSVLSVQECCCAWLCASGASARALLRALAACAARAPLAVRLAYTLGNMAAADERARNNIYNEEGGIDVLLTILESYTKRNDHEGKDPDADPDLHLVSTDLGGSDGSNEDVLIKTVRVVANLCLAERAGRGLAATYAERTVKALLACLELAEKSTEEMKISEEEHVSLSERHEELATAALATLNNITFYREPPDPPDPLDDVFDRICKVTCRWLTSPGCASCEAARALGNLTRAPRVAQLIILEGALDSLVPFLDHEESSVRCSAAGVLVNVCGAGAAAERAGGAAARALGAAAGRGDARAAALLARALWNAHAHAPLHAERARQAAAALAMFIDDDSVFTACEASRSGRRASDPSVLKHQVKFEIDINAPQQHQKISRTLSVDQNLHLEHISEDEALSGEDLGFEEGDIAGEECECGPCVRLAAWEELVGVAIPLLEKLRPPKADASVGTD